MTEEAQASTRILVMVDYWNLQLTMNEKVRLVTGASDPRFKFDWRKLPAWLVNQASKELGVSTATYVGTRIYASYNPLSPGSTKFKHWATTWLDRQAGIQVFLRERRLKAPPKCSSCHQRIEDCPHCQNRLAGTEEKGVDTLIATEMIRLAWEGSYDAVVLVTLDADLVPAVEFLDQKGRKVIQAGFPPKGQDLATSCWASFDLFAERKEFERTF
jgi:uncharacterized LabA/DUF88 family protein